MGFFTKIFSSFSNTRNNIRNTFNNVFNVDSLSDDDYMKIEESLQVEPDAYAVIVAKPFQFDFGMIVKVSRTSEMLIF